MPEVTSARRGAILVGIARGQIASALTAASPPVAPEETSAPWLYEPGASFVTLHQHGALRGCVGSLVAHGPLIDDLRHNAVAAALKDPRFAPLVAGELDEVDIEVTLLGELEPMSFTSEADALAQLCPGEDGVVLRSGEQRATFLPQV